MAMQESIKNAIENADVPQRRRVAAIFATGGLALTFAACSAGSENVASQSPVTVTVTETSPQTQSATPTGEVLPGVPTSTTHAPAAAKFTPLKMSAINRANIKCRMSEEVIECYSASDIFKAGKVYDMTSGSDVVARSEVLGENASKLNLEIALSVVPCAKLHLGKASTGSGASNSMYVSPMWEGTAPGC